MHIVFIKEQLLRSVIFFRRIIVYYNGVAQGVRTSIIFALALVRAVLLDEYIHRSSPPLHQCTRLTRRLPPRPIRTRLHRFQHGSRLARQRRLTAPRSTLPSAPAYNAAADSFTVRTSQVVSI